jgi:hypothetical protein
MLKILLLCLVLLLAPQLVRAGVVCDGVDDYGGNGPIGNHLTVSAGTIALWANPTGTAPSVGTVSLGQGLTGDYGTNIGLYRAIVGGLDRLWAYNYDGTETVVGGAYTVNTWTHVAWVHGSGTLRLYLNGLEAGNTPSGNTTNISFDTFLCVANFVSAPWFAGAIDDVRVFSTALSATDIAVLAGSRLRYGTLHNGTAYWPLDDCADGAAVDQYLFLQQSGVNTDHTMYVEDGANNTGMTCRASTILAYPWGAN